MFRAGYSEKVDRPEREALAGTAVEREFDLFAAVVPCAVVVFDLKTSEVGCRRTEEYNRPIIPNRRFRGNDIGRPFDPVASDSLY